MVPIRLAIVGCGTVAEGFYAPALRGFQGFSPVVMVDRQLHRAEILKSYFQSCAAETDFTALRERVDAAKLGADYELAKIESAIDAWRAVLPVQGTEDGDV